MTAKLDALNKRKDELETEIDALVDHDIDAVLNGGMPEKSAKILQLGQDLNIVSAARDRLIAAT